MKLSALSLVCCLFFGLSQADKDANVRWAPFTEGLKTATVKSKYVFVDVYTDWCGYCKQLDAVTFKASPVVAELEKNFISVKLNAESEMPLAWKGNKMTARELAGRWNVDGFPTLLFLNAKGDVIGSFSSYADPELMVKLLTYISSGARERKVSFEDFVKG